MTISTVTEAEVLASLPRGGFIEKYVEAAMASTDAHAGNHLMCALALMSLQVHVDHGFPFDGMLHANFFGLLVAGSGDRKSASVGFMRRHIVEAGFTHLLGREPASEEMLVDEVVRQPQQIMAITEFGNFLAQTKDSYRAAIKTRLNDLADGHPVARATVTKAKKKEEVKCDNPRVSFLGGVAPQYLEEFTRSFDWLGGFFSRYLVISTVRERSFDLPNFLDHKDKIDASVAMLKDRLSSVFHPSAVNDPLLALDQSGSAKPMAILGPCLGLDASARAQYGQWYRGIEVRRMAAPNSPAMAMATRLPTHVLRVAFLYAVDVYAPRDGSGWYVPQHCLNAAIQFADFHTRSVTHILDTVAATAYGVLRRNVLKAVEREGTRLGDILIRTKQPRKTIADVLDSLITEGLVRKMEMLPGQNEERYQRTDAVIVDDGDLQRIILPAEAPPAAPIDTAKRQTTTGQTLQALPSAVPSPPLPMSDLFGASTENSASASAAIASGDSDLFPS